MRFADLRRGAVRGLAFVPLLALGCAAQAATPSIIPLPASMTVEKGSYAISGAAVIHVKPGDRAAADAAHYLADLLVRTRGLSLPAVGDASATSRGDIVIRSDAAAGPALDTLRHGMRDTINDHTV